MGFPVFLTSWTTLYQHAIHSFNCSAYEWSPTALTVCCPAPSTPPPSALQDLLQRAKRELTRQNATAIIAVCKVVREMRGLEQHYAFLLAELPSRNFIRYSVLVDKFEALVSSKVFLE